MANKIVKISTIKKEPPRNGVRTMQHGLSEKGLTRAPGTGVFKFPFKLDGNRYLTGLDDKAEYIKRIQDPTEREAEIERVRRWKKEIAEELMVSEELLNPTSKFWNYTLYQEGLDELHVTPVKLLDGDNYFNLDNVREKIAFAWLRVHPTIAVSYQAYERGDYGPDVQFYVADDELDTQLVYKKKSLINKAIVELDEMAPSKRVKVARLMGLPVSDDMKEESVYNLLDNTIKAAEIKTGEHKGINPIALFTRFAHMENAVIEVSDLVEQAISHNIYRHREGGKLFEGTFKLADSKADWVKHLLDPDNQEDFLALREKLKMKKIASV